MRTLLNGLYLFLLLFVLTACNMNLGGTGREGTDDRVKQEQKTIKVLIVGIDSRGEAKSRSDAILVGQYNPAEQSMKLASIMRDTYVKIPTYAKGSNKINVAYFLGGKELLQKTIEENFDIKVDHVVTVDFQGFTHIIDAVAPNGIEVDVSKEMIEDMNLALQPGVQALHGDQLLKYVRFRHDSESDFGRVKRQQEVMVKLKEQLSNNLTSITQMVALPKMIEETSQYVESDLSFTDILTLTSILLLHQVESVDTMTIPVANGFTNKSYDHAGSVLEIDPSKNTEAIQNFFQAPKEVSK